MKQNDDTEDNIEGDCIINEDVQNNRTNMAILHFVMTAPKWSLSLFLFFAARHAPLDNPRDAIDAPLRRLQTALTHEARSYQNCAITSLDRLHEELNRTAELERLRVEEYHSANQVSLQNAQDAAEICSYAAIKTRDLLIQWRTNGMDLTWEQNSSICSEKDKVDLENILEEDFRMVENEVSVIWDDYTRSTTHVLELVRSYAASRFSYDYDYFVNDRIQPAMDVLQAVSSPVHFQPFTDQIEIERRMRESFAEIESAMEHTKGHVEALNTRLQHFSSSVDDFHNAYVDLYNRLVLGANFVYDVLPPGVPMPAFLDVASIPLAESLLPSIDHLPTIEEEFKSTRLLLNNATIQCLSVLNSVIVDVETQANQRLRGTTNNLTEAIYRILAFDDYDPPVYSGSEGGVSDLLEEIGLQERRGKEARDNTKETLGRLQHAGNAELETLSQEPVLASFNQSFSEGSTSFDYLQPNVPQISIPQLLRLLLSWVFTNAWAIELIVQGFRLWRLESMYSKGVTPELPEIDYGDGDQDQDNPPTTCSILTTLLRSFASVWIFLLAAFFPMFVFLAACWRPHVKVSCQGQPTGTFLANQFLTPLLVNQANALGNSHFLKAEFQCHQSQQLICNEARSNDAARYQSHQLAAEAIQNLSSKSFAMIANVAKCVDQDTISKIDGSCCGLKGFAGCKEPTANSFCPIDESQIPESSFRPLGEYLSEQACLDHTLPWDIENELYDCVPLIETCSHIPCDGVNEVHLRSQIVQADCEIETYLLGCCCFVFYFFYHAIAANVVSTMIFNGTRQVLWRKLCPSGIRLRTRLLEDGRLARGKEKGDRAGRISVVISRFELIGRLQIGLGVLALLIWVVSAILMSV